ncbi:hypothetical protein Y032_0032g2625 [Ancylostoma ceylanicum]|uniref:Uncharacterized protein n=2 Tax=Ancylostoma ceylanicum TaxID=53326 RepID=A0A016UQD1_9BILA|nr:hypothetical protein Y032_0032g2625 [Ancylostoma ceylanicum]
MSGKCPTAFDDIVSCLYMLTEFVLGYIPWSSHTEKQAIINEKKKVEEWDRVEDGKRNTLLINYRNLYEWLRNQHILHTIDYEAFYEELLKTPDSGGPPDRAADQSLFGFSNPLNDVYDHGFAEKKGGGKTKRGKDRGDVSRTASSHVKEEKGTTESVGKLTSQSRQASGGDRKDYGSAEKHSKEKEKEPNSGDKASKKKSLHSGNRSAEKSKEHHSSTPGKSKEKSQEKSKEKSKSNEKVKERNAPTSSSNTTGLKTPTQK